MKSSGSKKLIKIAVGIVGLVLVYLLGVFASRMIYGREDDRESQQAAQSVETPKPAMTEEELEARFRSMKEVIQSAPEESDQESDTALENGDAAGSGENPVQEAESTLDFEYLKSQNEDIYAWITVPGTNIDYPVLQHPTDDSYYLNHNLDGSYGYPGCIYTESLNAKDFSDPNTVIYGHNMKAKTMFAQLHNFESKDFFNENRDVYIYLPDQELHYKIFAAYVYDDRHLLYSFNFHDEAVFGNYLQSIYDIRSMSANIDRDMTVTEKDKIITMSTCMPDEADADKRLLVQAVLVEEM